MSEVIVIPDEAVAEPVVETVIVESADENISEDITEAISEVAEVERELDDRERLVNLERDVMELRGQLWDAEGNAAWALSLAESNMEQIDELAENDAAIVDAVDAADADIIDAVEDAEIDGDEDTDIEVSDIEPVSARIHPLFRPLKGWRD